MCGRSCPDTALGDGRVLNSRTAGFLKERDIAMGDKGKGKDAGKVKKPKASKRGLRPHEERQRDALSKPAPALVRSA